MVKTLSTSAVTAIHGSDFESFAASTLFSQGWSVLHRALDWSSLIDFLETLTILPDVVLLSTDLEGINIGAINELRARGIQIFLFRKRDEDVLQFPDSLPEPTAALELIGLVRGSIRKPLLRASEALVEENRGHILAIASAHSGAGCTSLAINIASELSLLSKKVLIVDANVQSPAVAILLGEQGLHSAKSFQKISNNLWAMEVTQENIAESITLLERAKMEFDHILIDAGVIADLASVLRGRRWTGEVIVWVTSHADELWIISKSNRVAVERVRTVAQALLQNSIKPTVSFVQSMSSQSKKSSVQDEAFLSTINALRPKKIHRYPHDPRSIAAAESELLSLYESNERSSLRKSVVQLAGEVGA